MPKIVKKKPKTCHFDRKKKQRKHDFNIVQHSVHNTVWQEIINLTQKTAIKYNTHNMSN